MPQARMNRCVNAPQKLQPKEKEMGTNYRFSLNEERYVIDMLNPANTGKGYCHDGDPEDDMYLRERVLMVRLGEMLKALIIPTEPMKKDRFGNEYRPFNEEEHSIWRALLAAIHASHLNTLDAALSLQHKFGGKLKREKKGMQDFTSLSLFRDDVEHLLRDLYGDIETEALDSVLRAVFCIVEECTKYVRTDLWKEHTDAVDMDYMLGIGVPDGYGISGSDHRRGMAAKFDLIVRACEVGANPFAFSEYTVEFAKRFGEHWMLPANYMEFLSLSDEMKMRW
jgi:hypothetical protein